MTSYAPVLIVGAGPVGCMLALELATHEVPCVLLERSLTPSRYPKMDYINGRSMELLRRFGLAAEIRERGVGTEHRSNFIWTRGFEEPPVAVWDVPSPDELAERGAKVNDGTVPLEPYQRMQGSLLEGIVREHVRRKRLIDFREGWSFTALSQDAGGADVEITETATGEKHTLRARYVAACDGAGSRVRERLGIPMDALAGETVHCSVYFRSSDPLLRKYGRAFVTIGARGINLVARDETDTWTGSFVVPDGSEMPEDPIASLRERLGADFAVDEVMNVSQWRGTLAVARSYRQGVVFLAGDSAHHFYPVGGHGANTGLADATDLGWKLAALLQEWGGPALLDSYEAERRPVALFTREMCNNFLDVFRRFPRMVTEGATREQIVGVLREEKYHVDNAGIHFGHRYGNSPVVAFDGESEPEWSWRQITPVTSPGLRAPSVRLTDGTPLFDLFGTGYTLVDLSGNGAGETLAAEADRRSLPLTHLEIDDADVRSCWIRELVLVRPDQYVAWQADRAPEDPTAVLDLVCGNVSPRKGS